MDVIAHLARQRDDAIERARDDLDQLERSIRSARIVLDAAECGNIARWGDLDLSGNTVINAVRSTSVAERIIRLHATVEANA